MQSPNLHDFYGLAMSIDMIFDFCHQQLPAQDLLTIKVLNRENRGRSTTFLDFANHSLVAPNKKLQLVASLIDKLSELVAFRRILTLLLLLLSFWLIIIKDISVVCIDYLYAIVLVDHASSIMKRYMMLFTSLTWSMRALISAAPAAQAMQERT